MDSISSKLYNKIVPLTNGSVSAIQLKDTAGNIVNCNYINVIVPSSAGGYVHVLPSSVYAGSVLPSATTANSSGAGGFLVTGGNTLEIVLTNKVNGLSITNMTGGTLSVLVNYGAIAVTGPTRRNDQGS